MYLHEEMLLQARFTKVCPTEFPQIVHLCGTKRALCGERAWEWRFITPYGVLQLPSPSGTGQIVTDLQPCMLRAQFPSEVNTQRDQPKPSLVNNKSWRHQSESKSRCLTSQLPRSSKRPTYSYMRTTIPLPHLQSEASEQHLETDTQATDRRHRGIHKWLSSAVGYTP